MDEKKEARHDSLGICTKLYNFITRTLTLHALKTVTLGKASLVTPSGGVRAQAVHPMCQDVSVEGQSVEAMVGPEEARHISCHPDIENRCVELTEGEKQPEEATRSRAEGEVVSDKKGPKKMVSINERVEEIRKGNRRNKPFVMLSSFDTEIDETKPLKSILKVGSTLNAGV